MNLLSELNSLFEISTVDSRPTLVSTSFSLITFENLAPNNNFVSGRASMQASSLSVTALDFLSSQRSFRSHGYPNFDNRKE